MLPTELNCRFYGYNVRLEDSALVLFGADYSLSPDTYSVIPFVADYVRMASRLAEDASLVENGIYYSGLKVYDAGNLTSADYESIDVDVSTILSYCRARGKKPILFSIDHAYTYFMLKHLKPDLLVVLDAHLDLKERYLGGDFNRATFMNKAIKERLVDRVVYVGTRAFEKEEVEVVRDVLNDKVFIFKKVEPGLLSKLDELISKCDKVYLSIDLDVLDPSVLQHVTYPEPLGIGFSELVAVLSNLKKNGCKVCGADVSEYCPRDYNLWSAILTARVILETLVVLHPGE